MAHFLKVPFLPFQVTGSYTSGEEEEKRKGEEREMQSYTNHVKVHVLQKRETRTN